MYSADVPVSKILSLSCGIYLTYLVKIKTVNQSFYALISDQRLLPDNFRRRHARLHQTPEEQVQVEEVLQEAFSARVLARSNATGVRHGVPDEQRKYPGQSKSIAAKIKERRLGKVGTSGDSRLFSYARSYGRD